MIKCFKNILIKKTKVVYLKESNAKGYNVSHNHWALFHPLQGLSKHF